MTTSVVVVSTLAVITITDADKQVNRVLLLPTSDYVLQAPHNLLNGENFHLHRSDY
jgi:hypothetical protein